MPMPQRMSMPQPHMPPPFGAGMTRASLTTELKFQNRTAQLISKLIGEKNDLREEVGECIYEYVLAIAGEKFAPKVTGMMIELPRDDKIAYLTSYQKFESKVEQAVKILTVGKRVT